MIYNKFRQLNSDEMNLCTLYNNKKCADKIWEKVLLDSYEKAAQELRDVKKDHGELVQAIEHCNMADKQILEFIFKTK